MQAPSRALAAAALIATAAILAGCASSPEPEASGLVPVTERAAQPFQVDTYYSHTLQKGPYGAKPVESVFVDVALPPSSLGAAVIGGAGPLASPRVHLGLFLPDMPAGTKVPVIADIGPYYNDLDLPATSDKTRRLGGFLIENFVPHGYAVAQVSVFGTGDSNHCMDLMGPDEQAGIDAAVTWLGSQEWSNGRVGLIGRSYDGSTPWEAAAMGNPYLSTIVPISGLIGQYELMWRNGTVETRGPIMHNGVYGFFGVDSLDAPLFGTGGAHDQPDPEDVQNLCAGYLQGPAAGGGAYATGGNLGDAGAQYWRDRYFLDRALANWNGSVYLIHGLQDWNVKPHMAFPTYNILVDAGLEVKGLFGQWAHMYPDRPSEHANLPTGEGEQAFPHTVRYDWAQDLLEWFDHYLKGTGPKPALHAEVQDNMGNWRIESAGYPSDDLVWQPLTLAEGFKQTSPGDPLVKPASDATQGRTGDGIVTFAATQPLAQDTHVAGLATFHVEVQPLGENGQLYVELRDIDADLRLGHAVMDLRYAAGGTTMQPVVPGTPLTARMEFEAMDVVVPAGHHLGIWVSSKGREYLPAAGAGPVAILGGTLSLPTLPAGHGTPFVPPSWSGDVERTDLDP